MKTTLRGLSQSVEIHNAAEPTQQRPLGEMLGTPSNKVIGVVCSGDLAVHRDQVKTTLERGKAQRSDAVWVCFESKSDRMTRDLMLSLDMDPVVLPLNDEWRSRHEEHGYDLRRTWRDLELLHCCDEVIVFHKRTGSSPWRERASDARYAGKLFVVELGQEKTRAKARTKTRKKPVGA
jgi:hypothetical protein